MPAKSLRACLYTNVLSRDGLSPLLLTVKLTTKYLTRIKFAQAMQEHFQPAPNDGVYTDIRSGLWMRHMQVVADPVGF